jgi:hypothetical protein
MGVDHLTALDLVVGSAAKPEPQPKPKRKRRPTLISVAKQAARAGLEVKRYEVDPDGKISIVTGKPDITNPETGNEWDSVLQ